MIKASGTPDLQQNEAEEPAHGDLDREAGSADRQPGGWAVWPMLE